MEDYTDGLGEVKLPYGAFFTLTNKLYGALAIEIILILQDHSDLVPEAHAEAFENALSEIAQASDVFSESYKTAPNCYTHEIGIMLACMMEVGETAGAILPYVSVTIDLDDADTLHRMVNIGKDFIVKLAEGGE